jgi:hypothetical protein
MSYKLTQIKLSISKFFKKIAEFFDVIIFHTKKSLHLIKTSEKTKIVGYHAIKTSKNLISKTMENAWNWNHRLTSSESFRIFDKDV